MSPEQTTASPLQTAPPPTPGGPTTAFADRAHRRRALLLIAGLGVLAALTTIGILGAENPADAFSRGWWIIARLRAEDLVVIAVVCACQSFATVSFQTATQNRIITPSIMGFESIYVLIQTSLVFFFGISGLSSVHDTAMFFLQAGIMMVFAVALYSWLLSGRHGNLHVLLLVGIIIGGGLGSLSTFLQRLLDPNAFDILSARLFGNISNARTEYLPYAIPIALGVCLILWLRTRRMNAIVLGRDVGTNLGLHHTRELMTTLLLVSILMAMTTSLVGPMTFLGFLVATVAYALTDTYDHRVILPVAFLSGYTLLTGSYYILRHIFYAQGSVTIIVELIGGLVFLSVIMRKGRL